MACVSLNLVKVNGLSLDDVDVHRGNFVYLCFLYLKFS